MLKVPQLKDQLEEIGGQGFDRTRISDITRDWVNGKGLNDIAMEYFSRKSDENGTEALSDAWQGYLPGDCEQWYVGRFGIEPNVWGGL